MEGDNLWLIRDFCEILEPDLIVDDPLEIFTSGHFFNIQQSPLKKPNKLGVVGGGVESNGVALLEDIDQEHRFALLAKFVSTRILFEVGQRSLVGVCANESIQRLKFVVETHEIVNYLN